MCCYSEKWKKKQKRYENKSEKPKRQQKINRSYQQQIQQPTPSKERAVL